MSIFVNQPTDDAALVVTYDRPFDLERDVAPIREQVAAAASSRSEVVIVHDVRSMGNNAGGVLSALASVMRPGSDMPEGARFQALVVGQEQSMKLVASSILHHGLAVSASVYESPEQALASLI